MEFLTSRLRPIDKMIKHLNIKVIGKVQGVWFRKSTMESAQRLGVKGFVRNEPDGSVYIEAEGSEQQLLEFTAWCKHGPQLARVDKLEISESGLINFSSFRIL